MPGGGTFHQSFRDVKWSTTSGPKFKAGAEPVDCKEYGLNEEDVADFYCPMAGEERDECWFHPAHHGSNVGRRNAVKWVWVVR